LKGPNHEEPHIGGGPGMYVAGIVIGSSGSNGPSSGIGRDGKMGGINGGSTDA
jgi:hypothetical protein